MFTFSQKSLDTLNQVKEPLQKVAKLALAKSEVDFGIVSGLRTQAQQNHLVAIGASQKRDSKHLRGDAIDICPYVNGAFNDHDWEYFYKVAAAFKEAAKELNITIRWGGNWYVNLTDTTKPVKEIVQDYVQKRKALGKTAFIDGAHFELV